MARRRRRGSIWRYLWIPIVLVWVMPTLVGTLWTLVAAMAAAVVAVPLLLVGAVVAIVLLVVVAALVAAAAAGLVALPAWLVWRASRDSEPRRGRTDTGRPGRASREDEAARLRREYVAGQLNDDQFRDAMLANLKARFAGGSLDVSEYEAEVGRLVNASVAATPLRELRRKSQALGPDR